MQQYLIGSRKRLELEIEIENAGEDAFEAMLHLFMPLDVNFVNTNKTRLVSLMKDITNREQLTFEEVILKTKLEY